VIRVALSVPDSFVARARYAFTVLATRWCVPVRFAAQARDADVCYATASASCPADVTWFRFDPELYDPRIPCRSVRDEHGRWLWCSSSPAGAERPDLVGGVFRLLTLLDESQIDEEHRDRRGIFRTHALPAGRAQVLDEPLVEHHAEALWEQLVRHAPERAARVPRWPQGKRFVVAPSHDVDAVQLGGPGELATNLAKAVLRRDPQRLQLFTLGARHLGRMPEDPYFAFAKWQEWEARRGLKSAFYVFHRPPGTPRDVNDCKSSLAHRGADWDRLRRLADEGWEFGLHPSIHSKDTEGAFAASKAWIESKLERPVYGLRHHYWALDWRDPIATNRQHQQAGFRYDSSIAWRDRAGFRAGTALPYHPFDSACGRALDLVEIPCVLMDSHILHDAKGRRTEAAAARALGLAIVERVRACGGVLTPNWHQESAFNRLHYDGYLEALDDLLQPLVDASDVWLATPDAVGEHWRKWTTELALAE
jgi:hypothetical protein